MYATATGLSQGSALLLQRTPSKSRPESKSPDFDSLHLFAGSFAICRDVLGTLSLSQSGTELGEARGPR